MSAVCGLWACAAERSPSGGPVDTDGPEVLRSDPPNETRGMSPDQDITVWFDESVDPVTVPGSVVFTPNIPFTVRVRGRRVIIRPADLLAPDQTYILTLHRGIHDYQKNSLPQPRQFVFSTGFNIPTGGITGSIANADPGKPVAVGLFRPDSTGAFSLFQSVDLGAEGDFSFAYLAPGAYRLAALEGGLADFPEGLHRRPYALPFADTLFVRELTVEVPMRLSPPLAQPQILSVDWQTPRYLQLIFDVPFGEAPVPPALYPGDNPTTFGYRSETPGPDSTTIDLGTGWTSLGEPYTIRPFTMSTPELVDTLPPAITASSRQVALRLAAAENDDSDKVFQGRVSFTEPVTLPEGLMIQLTGRDTLETSILQTSPVEASWRLADPTRYQQAAFVGVGIIDEAGNALADSVVTLVLKYDAPEPTGQIRGAVINVTGPTVVEALHVETGERAAFTVTDSSAYLIENVPPGFYRVFAHEQIGARPLPYYSGSWLPYQRSAHFGSYDEVVEVRPRWEVDGIDINFRIVSTNRIQTE